MTRFRLGIASIHLVLDALLYERMTPVAGFTTARYLSTVCVADGVRLYLLHYFFRRSNSRQVSGGAVTRKPLFPKARDVGFLMLETLRGLSPLSWTIFMLVYGIEDYQTSALVIASSYHTESKRSHSMQHIQS